VRNRFLLLIVLSMQYMAKTTIFYITPFFPSSWNCLYMTRKKKMIIGRSRREVNDVMCMYTCLWPSICSSSFFEKTARIQAHHMCYRRAHPFFFFFPVLCLTCSIITPILHVDVCVSKEDEQRERERTKDAKKSSTECV